MASIISDTSVWIDFHVIDHTGLPFCLPHTYLMSTDAIDDEILAPAGLRDALLRFGLVRTNLTSPEFFLAEAYGLPYKRLSVYDRIALAIAKNRQIILLTGDGALRKEASREQVHVLGTPGILDQ